MNTYTKLKSGQWGIRVEGTAVTGQAVNIQTKAGKVRSEKVGSVLWSGPDKWTGKLISLCSVLRGTDSWGNRISDGSSYRAGVTAPGGRCCGYCGSRECEGAWGGLCCED